METIYDKTSLKTGFYSSLISWKGVTSALVFIDYPFSPPSRADFLQCLQNRRNLATLVGNIEFHINDFLGILDARAFKDEPVDGAVVRLHGRDGRGSSTTSHTAAFTCGLLTRHPAVQERLAPSS